MKLNATILFPIRRTLAARQPKHEVVWFGFFVVINDGINTPLNLLQQFYGLATPQA